MTTANYHETFSEKQETVLLQTLDPQLHNNLIPGNIYKENKEQNRLPSDYSTTEKNIKGRIDFLKENTNVDMHFLSGKKQFTDLSLLNGNIENFIGLSMVPTGIIGPVKIQGTHANGSFFVPLATSEGALVASYHRGAKACYLSGGVTSLLLSECVQRCPFFKFKNLADLHIFITWTLTQIDKFKNIVSQTSRFAKLTNVKSIIEGNNLTLVFEYYTGDAAGQNMVTLCTDAACKYIIANAPVPPVFWLVDGNTSGDKKATAQSFMSVRGKKVTAEVLLPKQVVEHVLKTTAKAMEVAMYSSTIGALQSGSIGVHGHFANGLAALFIATGQDAACVAEASVGITRMEVTDDESLYASVTLPNLIVGTVGGGTKLPTQKECLQLMDCYGDGKAGKFAEICAAVLLAGELSIVAAMSAGHFSSAHKKLGRSNV